MSDTIELRDHSRPCEHTGSDWEDGPLRLGAYQTGGVWECFVDDCPGGKKIVLQEEAPLHVWTAYLNGKPFQVWSMQEEEKR